MFNSTTSNMKMVKAQGDMSYKLQLPEIMQQQ
jgi:hypothetical protein